MTDTRDKLNEAAYFLSQMRANIENRDGFRYNLSAFLSALRSTDDFMKKEYTHTNGFLTWHGTKTAEMNADSILRFFKKQRNNTIHVRRVATQSQVQFYSPAIDLSKFTGEQPISFTFKASISESGKPEFQMLNIAAPDEAIAGEPSYEVAWLFEDLSETDNPQKLDVVALCSQQLEKISVIVDECEQLFTI